jgi:cytochrome P450
MGNLVYYMAATPEVQDKVATEVGRVVGESRLPNIDDIPYLPYIFAYIKEILRLCPVPP